MNSFVMNGDLWQIIIVDPSDQMLVDRTGTRTVATTDPMAKCVYLSSTLHGDFLIRVLIHELGHCAMISFNLLDDIRNSVYPSKWIDAEEWICNFIADYGFKIFSVAYSVLGENAWICIPKELEKIIG